MSVRRNVALAVGALVLAGAASATTVDGAGSPVVLRMAIRDSDFGSDPAAGDFLTRVQELSRGALRIEIESYWGNGATDAEQQLVRGVSAGQADLGTVGTRALDELGVRSFQALTAPMLIDSYPLERSVLASGLAAQMLRGLEPLKLTGLSVLGEGLRKPVAVKRPLLGLADWHGITFAAFRSLTAAATVRAFGARPTNVWGDALSTGLTAGTVQGAENDLLVYYSNDRQAIAPYVTANVSLWPRTEVVFANSARFARLTAEQQGWLRQAAAAAATHSTSFWDHDARLAAELCKAGAHLVNASPTDLAALRKALAPVYAGLERDPQTRTFIARIAQLKRSTPARPLAFPAGCSGQTRTTQASFGRGSAPRAPTKPVKIEVGSQPFDAQFHEKPCGSTAFCGTGVLAGFGNVKTKVEFRSVGAGVAPGCTAVKGVRTLTLVKDPSTTLRLAVQGSGCGARAFGTFTVSSGTGIFAHAVGGGVIWGPPLSIRFYGSLALAS